MSVRIKGLDKLKSDRQKLLDKMAGETTRIVTRTRSLVATTTLSELKRSGMVSKNFTKEVLTDRYLFPMGRDTVTPARLTQGFFRTQKIPDLNKGLSFFYLRVRVNKVTTRIEGVSRFGPNAGKPSKKGRRTKRYRVSLILGSEKRPYPGVFLVVNKKWTPKPTADWFGAFRRSGPDRKPIEYVRGPNLVELLGKQGGEMRVKFIAYRSWEEQLKDRLGRLVERFHPGRGFSGSV